MNEGNNIIRMGKVEWEETEPNKRECFFLGLGMVLFISGNEFCTLKSGTVLMAIGAVLIIFKIAKFLMRKKETASLEILNEKIFYTPYGKTKKILVYPERISRGYKYFKIVTYERTIWMLRTEQTEAFVEGFMDLLDSKY